MFNDYTHPTEFTMHRPGALEGMQFYVDLSVMQGVAPRLFPPQGQNLLNISAGNVAIAGEAAPPTLQPPKFDYDIRLMASPRGPNGRYIRAAMEVLWIPATSRNKDEAWKLTTLTSSAPMGLIGPILEQEFKRVFWGEITVASAVEAVKPQIDAILRGE